MEKFKANFKDGVIEDGYMWVFDNLLQAMCKIDLDTYVMEIVARYEGKEDFEADWLLRENDCFYLVNRKNVKLVKYNIVDRTFMEILIYHDTKASDCALASAFIYNHVLWLIPIWIRENVYCYDTRNEEVFVDNDVIQKVRDYKGNKKAFCRWCFVRDGVLWATIWCGTAYMRYDLKNKECQIYDIKNKEVEFAGICYDGEHVWISRFDSGNIAVISKDGVYREIEKAVYRREPYSMMVDMGKYIAVLPSKGDELLVIDKNNYDVTCYEMDYGTSARNKDGNLCLKSENYVLGMDKLYILPSESNVLFVFDSILKEVKEVKLICDFNYEIEKIRRYVENKRYIKETEMVKIECLINWIKDEKVM